MFKLPLHLLLCFLVLSATAAHASDKAKEKRWAEQVVDSVLIGEVQWLDVNNQKILSIYTPVTTPKTVGGRSEEHTSELQSH